jgi:ParB-like chromosome segregation protein Spo0J
MTNDTVDLIEITKLVPYEGNVKIHSDEQVEKLAKLITKFGFSAPIVVDRDLVIIAGHGRRLAAIKLGLKKVPVIVKAELTKEEANALRLADNKIASQDYDQAAQADQLRELAEHFGDTFDLTDLGYSEAEINFTLDDLGEMNGDMFVEDIAGAVEQQKEENKSKTAEIDDVAAPVGDALGFKRVTIAESRVIKELMGKMEARTGKSGVGALIEFVSAHV